MKPTSPRVITTEADIQQVRTFIKACLDCGLPDAVQSALVQCRWDQPPTEAIAYAQSIQQAVDKVCMGAGTVDVGGERTAALVRQNATVQTAQASMLGSTADVYRARRGSRAH